MIQAHCTGALDLATADTSDPRWWKKVWFTLDYLGREAWRKADEYAYQFHLALLDYQLDAERFDLHIEQATATRNALTACLMPWENVGPTELVDVVQSMKQRYIEVFGDPDDPEFQKEIERTAAFLRRGDRNV